MVLCDYFFSYLDVKLIKNYLFLERVNRATWSLRMNMKFFISCPLEDVNGGLFLKVVLCN